MGSEFKYHVGDKVVVNDLGMRTRLGHIEMESIAFPMAMDKYIGQTVTIWYGKGKESSFTFNTYKCKETDDWWFDERWLEPAPCCEPLEYGGNFAVFEIV